MPDHIYKTIELTGSSPEGIETAIQNAVSKAAETVHKIRWFQTTDIRGHVIDGKIAHWQVTLKIGFALED